MARPSRHHERLSLQFWLLSCFVTLVFLMGGSARADVSSLPILRPLSVVACGVALLTLSREQVLRYRALMIGMGFLVVAVAVQLVPLPPVLWQAIPGRDVIAQIDTATAVGMIWRPVSMTPTATWNALYALAVPVAVLLFGVQLDRHGRATLLVLLILLGMLTGLLGLLQVSAGKSALYFYAVVNRGSGTGLFANRNHQALMLATLFPMLAVHARAGVHLAADPRLRLSLAAAAGTVLIPLLLVTGSRAGFIAGVIGLCSVPVLYGRRPSDETTPRRSKFSPQVVTTLIIGGGVAALGLIVVLFSRAQALTRLLSSGDVQDLRFQTWGPVWQMAKTYFPFGSGAGSFDPLFRMHEPAALLRPTYMNHAHNDWLEIFLTNGVGGVALLVAAIVMWVAASSAAWRGKAETRRLALTGSLVLAMIAAASVTDYPIRVPSIMCVVIIAAIWLCGDRRDVAPTTNAASKP